MLAPFDGIGQGAPKRMRDDIRRHQPRHDGGPLVGPPFRVRIWAWRVLSRAKRRRKGARLQMPGRHLHFQKSVLPLHTVPLRFFRAHAGAAWARAGFRWHACSAGPFDIAKHVDAVAHVSAFPT